MPEKLIDKGKWDKITYYLDIVMVIVFIGVLYLMVMQSMLVGFYYYEGQVEESFTHYTAALWGLVTEILIAALILFWLYYRYFKARFEKKKW